MDKYNYGGVELPPLPVYDNQTYPYAMLQNVAGSYRLMVTDTRPVYDSSVDGGIVCRFTESGNGKPYMATDDSWTFLVDTIINAGDTFYPVFWANFDVLDESGAVRLAASVPKRPFDLQSFLLGFVFGLAGKPLPFAKKEPVAFLRGWLIGRRLAGMRSGEQPVAITQLSATFDPLTAELGCGEAGFSGTATEFMVGYNDQKIYYKDGHLIVEDVYEQ